MQWFRFYSEAIRDTKLRRIARDVGQPLPYVIGVWATVLSIASESPERGVLLVSKNIPATIDDISDAAGCNVSETFQKLLVTGLVTSHVTEGETVYSVASWEKRQYDTDSSTERVRKWRESQKNAQSQADETLQKRFSNAPDTDTDTDTDTEKKQTTTSAAPIAKTTKNEVVVVGDPARYRHACDLIHQNGFGMMTPILAEQVHTMLTEYPDEWIDKAFEVAVKANKRRLDYAIGVLENWRRNGFDNRQAKAAPTPTASGIVAGFSLDDVLGNGAPA